MDNLKEIIETTGKAESILSDTKFLKNMADRNICFFKCERCGGDADLTFKGSKGVTGKYYHIFCKKNTSCG